MGRTVTSPIDLPRDSAFAKAVVTDLDGLGGGLQLVGGALNTLYEEHRGPLINDYNVSAILANTSDVAYYRVKVQGGSSLTDEKGEVAFHVTATGFGGLTVTMTIGGDTASYTTAAAVDGWYGATTGQIDLPDDAEYMDVSVQITASTFSTYEVKGIHLRYARDKAALTAAPAAQYGYTGSGVVPIEMTQLDGEKPCSTARLHDMHAMAIRLYEERNGTFVASAFPADPKTGSSTGLTRVWADVPTNNVNTIGAEIWIKASGSSDVVTATTEGDSDTVTVTADAWYNLEVDFPAPRHGASRPALGYVDIDPDDADITSICGYWADASY